MALIDDVGVGPVALDTAIFIYFIEEDQRYLPLISPLFSRADEGKLDLMVCALTLLEVLVVPYRAGDLELAQRYEALLTRSRGVRMIDITRNHLRLAAQLRATTGAATPDALLLSISLSARCATFLTNDRRMPAVSGLKILQLDAYRQR
ncbi:MAG: PIN domain-containing protein [Alphaproteobacteria bacterium]|nr:PIN domain-containing protein [Alphaproteobacteria bacterium]MBV8409306.1 PIN domain-containing protein [Alphaproteobacteria bacterium]